MFIIFGKKAHHIRKRASNGFNACSKEEKKEEKQNK